MEKLLLWRKNQTIYWSLRKKGTSLHRLKLSAILKSWNLRMLHKLLLFWKVFQYRLESCKKENVVDVWARRTVRPIKTIISVIVPWCRGFIHAFFTIWVKLVYHVYASVGTNVGDIALWEVGSRERLVLRNFKVWDLSSCSMPLQVWYFNYHLCKTQISSNFSFESETSIFLLEIQTALVKDPGVSVNCITWSPDGSLFGKLGWTTGH